MGSGGLGYSIEACAHGEWGSGLHHIGMCSGSGCLGYSIEVWSLGYSIEAFVWGGEGGYSIEVWIHGVWVWVVCMCLGCSIEA